MGDVGGRGTRGRCVGRRKGGVGGELSWFGVEGRDLVGKGSAAEIAWQPSMDGGGWIFYLGKIGEEGSCWGRGD